MSEPTLLDLFSGVGGFSLAGRWAGFTTAAFCESDEYCRKVLRKNFGDVPCFDDIRDITADTLRRRGVGRPVLVTRGFPCQDISSAGRRDGLGGRAAASGTRCCALSRNSDRLGLWLRTSLLSGLGGLTPFSADWKRRATPAGRAWWVLTWRAHRTREGGRGLWPTPAASQTHKPVRALAPSERQGTHGVMLCAAVGDRHPELIGQYLTPEWLEALMGYPAGWSDVAPSETP